MQDTEGRLRTLSFAPEHARTVNGLFVPMLVPDPRDNHFLLYDVNHRQFMPRLGLAYRLTYRIVLRTGAGFFTTPSR